MLQLTIGLTLGLAGCKSVAPTQSSPDCPEGVEPIDTYWQVIRSSPFNGFQLRFDQDTYHREEELTVELRNVTEETRGIGSKSKFDLQYKSDSGWHTILGTSKGEPVLAYTDEEIRFSPGEGHTWDLTLSEDGLAEDSYGRLTCQPIKPGLYRFVFWGIGESDDAIGETFSVSGE